MLNQVVLMGRLTRDVELRTTQSGFSVCSFTLAVDRDRKQGNETVADFIPCTAWRGAAEFISKYFHKGSLILITGRIESRNYTDKEGNNRTGYEVSVDRASFTGERAEPSVSASDFSEMPLVKDSDVPF